MLNQYIERCDVNNHDIQKRLVIGRWDAYIEETALVY